MTAALFAYAVLATIWLTIALRANEDVARENRSLNRDLRIERGKREKAERERDMAIHPAGGRVVRGPWGWTS